MSNTPLLRFLGKIWPRLLNTCTVWSPHLLLPLLYFLLCLGGVLKPDHFLSHPAHGNPSAQQSCGCVLSPYVRLRSLRDTSPSSQSKYNLTCDGSLLFTNFEFEKMKQVQVKGSSTHLSWTDHDWVNILIWNRLWSVSLKCLLCRQLACICPLD